ncbi:hypothetical protein Tco_1262814 [Tanacetum coccineum]
MFKDVQSDVKMLRVMAHSMKIISSGVSRFDESKAKRVRQQSDVRQFKSDNRNTEDKKEIFSSEKYIKMMIERRISNEPAIYFSTYLSRSSTKRTQHVRCSLQCTEGRVQKRQRVPHPNASIQVPSAPQKEVAQSATTDQTITSQGYEKTRKISASVQAEPELKQDDQALSVHAKIRAGSGAELKKTITEGRKWVGASYIRSGRHSQKKGSIKAQMRKKVTFRFSQQACNIQDNQQSQKEGRKNVYSGQSKPKSVTARDEEGTAESEEHPQKIHMFAGSYQYMEVHEVQSSNQSATRNPRQSSARRVNLSIRKIRRETKIHNQKSSVSLDQLSNRKRESRLEVLSARQEFISYVTEGRSTTVHVESWSIQSSPTAVHERKPHGYKSECFSHRPETSQQHKERGGHRTMRHNRLRSTTDFRTVRIKETNDTTDHQVITASRDQEVTAKIYQSSDHSTDSIKGNQKVFSESKNRNRKRTPPPEDMSQKRFSS